MRGLVVAALATLAGVAGVVGLSAAVDGGQGEPAPEPATATTADPARLDARIDRLARAQRAADEALATTAAAPPVAAPAAPAPAAPAAAPVRTDDDGGDRWEEDDDDGGGHGRGRGRSGDD